MKLLLSLLLLGLTGCATSQLEIERRNKETVFQCKALCNNSTVEYIDVEGLRCICNLKREPAVTPVIINNGGGYTSSASSLPNIINVIPSAQTSNSNASKPIYSPIESADATKVVLPSGRTIISQTGSN